MFDLQQSLVKQLEQSIGSTVYNTLYINDEGKNVDCFEDGAYSCAWFVSSVLLQYGAISHPEIAVKRLVTLLEIAVVDGRIENVLEQKVLPGDILVWSALQVEGDDKPHFHVGFALNETEAVSTSYTEHCVRRHGVYAEYQGRRRKIVRHFRLAFEELSRLFSFGMNERHPASI